jgi:hypothetical protein
VQTLSTSILKTNVLIAKLAATPAVNKKPVTLVALDTIENNHHYNAKHVYQPLDSDA